jgi:hypothetical protein
MSLRAFHDKRTNLTYDNTQTQGGLEMTLEANVRTLVDTTTRMDLLSARFPRSAGYIASLQKILKDKTFTDELIEYLISEFISRNEPCAEKIIRAVDVLKDENPQEVVPAIKKAARSIYYNRINIFFSYKLKDETVASAVVKQIRGISGEKLNITYAKEFETGKDYRDKILRATRNANWFILLLPDPTDDWDWCLYESGLFRAKKLPGDRLICIHYKDNKIPDQISNFNAVAASKDKLAVFLHELFCMPDPVPGMNPINAALDVESIAEVIESVVSPPLSLKTVPFHEFVSVSIRDDNPLVSNNDLNEMEIIDATPGKLPLFRKIDRPDTWGDLTDQVTDKNQGFWRTELRQALCAARDKNIPDDIHATFIGCNGKHYLPVLHAKVQVEATGKIHSYLIDFIEDIKTADRTFIPETLRVLAVTLHLGLRFRWEILENKRYQDHVMCKEEADEIRMSIDRIMLEASQAGLQNSNLLKQQFQNEEHIRKIDDMSTKWQNLMNQAGTGFLDEALRNRDAASTSQILKELSPLNTEFLKVVFERFTEVLKDNNVCGNPVI